MIYVQRDGHHAKITKLELGPDETAFAWWCSCVSFPSWCDPWICDEGWESWSDLWLCLRAWRLHVATHNGEVTDFETYERLRKDLPNLRYINLDMLN